MTKTIRNPAMKKYLIVVTLMVFSTTANATLIGATVDITSVHGSCSGVTVGAGVECNIYDTLAQTDDVLSIDISDSSMVFDITDTAGNGGSFWTTSPRIFDVVIGSLFWVDDLTAAIDSISTAFQFIGGTPFGGDLGASITGANQITFHFNNFDSFCDRRTCARLTVDIVANHSTAVPEPGTLALLGIGLFGMGLARRRKKA